jgi:hypothetical protein
MGVTLYRAKRQQFGLLPGERYCPFCRPPDKERVERLRKSLSFEPVKIIFDPSIEIFLKNSKSTIHTKSSIISASGINLFK